MLITMHTVNTRQLSEDRKALGKMERKNKMMAKKKEDGKQVSHTR